jgi:hypothetical protein
MVNPASPVLVVDFGTTFLGGQPDRWWPPRALRHRRVDQRPRMADQRLLDADRGYVVGNRAEQRKHEPPLNFHGESFLSSYRNQPATALPSRMRGDRKWSNLGHPAACARFPLAVGRRRTWCLGCVGPAAGG